mgnify:CR=1 FL=1|jgi:hypothetical protein|tara:strand:- start:301 stop:1206 length:906 start_codon:yes stop_codon:yes gene_type:complete
MSFANLKSSRGSSIDKLVKAAEAVSTTKTESNSYDDDRFWKPTRDKAGNGYAVVRFLPAKEGEDLPWVRYWDHGFKGPTGLWYIENSLTSVGQDDPVSEMNSVLWNSGRDEDKATARDRKRRLHYVSNVMVISDPSNPANEGKVFLYKFGKKIFDKIMEAMQPAFEDESPVNPYDFWEGADFKIKIRKVEGWVNYDKSEFSPQSGLFDGDEDMLEGVFNKLHSLQDFTDPKNYKSYDELKMKMNKVLGIDAGAPAMEMPAMNVVESNPIGATADMAPVSTPAASDAEEDTLSYFAKLAQEN